MSRVGHLRAYNSVWVNNKTIKILNSWIQPRYIICGKYLSFLKRKYCPVCSKKIHNLSSSNYVKKNKKYVNERNRNYMKRYRQQLKKG